MARIVFFPLAETGHTNATFGLARRLQQRGHDVSYLSLADIQDHVCSQGWKFTPVFEDVFPKGYLEARYATLRDRSVPLRARYAIARDLDTRARAQLTEVVQGTQFATQLRALSPDLLLIDAT